MQSGCRSKRGRGAVSSTKSIKIPPQGIVLLLLGFFGNAIVRGKLACNYCKQKEIGFPAEQLFERKNT